MLGFLHVLLMLCVFPPTSFIIVVGPFHPFSRPGDKSRMNEGNVLPTAVDWFNKAVFCW